MTRTFKLLAGLVGLMGLMGAHAAEFNSDVTFHYHSYFARWSPTVTIAQVHLTNGGAWAAAETGTWHYAVAATNDQGRTTIGPVTSQVVTATGSMVRIQWNPVGGADGYLVFRGATATQLWQRATIGQVTSWIDAGTNAWVTNAPSNTVTFVPWLRLPETGYTPTNNDAVRASDIVGLSTSNFYTRAQADAAFYGVAGDTVTGPSTNLGGIYALGALYNSMSNGVSNSASASYGAFQRGFGGGSMAMTNAYGADQSGFVPAGGAMVMGPGSAIGSVQAGYAEGSMINTGAYGVLQIGSVIGDMIVGGGADGAIQAGSSVGTGVIFIAALADGAAQHGSVNGLMSIGYAADGASQAGYVDGSGVMFISDYADGASQEGFAVGRMSISTNAYGARQQGYVAVGSTAIVNGVGSMQLLNLTNGNASITAPGSLGLGKVDVSNEYSIGAAGWIKALTGFEGNGSGLSNIPAASIAAGGSFGAVNAEYLTNFPKRSTAYAVYYTDASTNLQPVALGANGSVLMSGGPASAPGFGVPTANATNVTLDALLNVTAATYTNGFIIMADDSGTNFVAGHFTNLVTNAWVLALIKQVDGPGSGLSADDVDGYDSSSFPQRNGGSFVTYLAVEGRLESYNTGRSALTTGIRTVTIPWAMTDTTYSVQCTYYRAPTDVATNLVVTEIATNLFTVTGHLTNQFFWTVIDY